MNNKLDLVLTMPALRSYAGSIYYGRGEEYFEDGYVGKLKIGDDYVSAAVRGTRRYTVKLSNRDGVLHGSCNCPLGQDYEFCKHQVALGLTYLASRDGKKNKTPSRFDWKKFVKSCSREDLEKIVFEMSPHCPKIVEQYRMNNLPTSGDAMAAEMKHKIDSLVAIADDCGYCHDNYYERDRDYEDEDYNEEFSVGLKQLKSALSKLADKQDFKILFDIVEYGIENIRKTSTYTEEPVSDFLDAMLRFYTQAVGEGIGEPEYLVEKIRAWENTSEYGGFGNLDALFDGLPEAVKNLWYEQSRKEWEKLPVLKMGSKNDDYRRRYMEARLREMADSRGEKDFSLEIRQRNLCRDTDVLELVAEYRRRKNPDAVLPLLIKARKHFPYSGKIKEELAAEQQKCGKHEDALKLAWKDFEANPLSRETFDFLMKTAKRAKCSNDYFEKVQSFLADREAKKSKSRSIWDNGNHIRARRVEILLDAGQNEQAWDLGKDADCGEILKLRLAHWRGKEHPDDAAAIYNELLKTALGPTGDEAYAHVVKLLRGYKEYLDAAGKSSQFNVYCQWIRTEFKRRKNLIALMEHHRLGNIES
ncbi:MAG: hypothetical protein JXR78_11975 [Victivallales bacterium]|nr:hypothetical protein [Victivallales bacterium]